MDVELANEDHLGMARLRWMLDTVRDQRRTADWRTLGRTEWVYTMLAPVLEADKKRKKRKI